MSKSIYIPELNRHISELELLQLEAMDLVSKLAHLNVRAKKTPVQGQVDMILLELEAAENSDWLPSLNQYQVHPIIRRLSRLSGLKITSAIDPIQCL